MRKSKIFGCFIDGDFVFLRKNRFPPKVRRLTMEEYYEQGIKETANSLEELRKFCSSPECEKWKLALQLKDVKR